jgi:glutamate/tyrosine decarboxylase-like PLP-dependent enzyme
MYLITASLTSAKLYKSYKAFPKADSITIDPHKMR